MFMMSFCTSDETRFFQVNGLPRSHSKSIYDFYKISSIRQRIFRKQHAIISKEKMRNRRTVTIYSKSLYNIILFSLNKKLRQYLHTHEKIYRERQSPCRIPLEGKNISPGTPLTRTKYETVLIH